MAAKADAKESKDSTPPADKAAAAPADAAAAAPAGGSALKAWLPAILAILLAPAASFAVAEYVLLPRLQKKLAAPPVPATDTAAPAQGEGGEKGKEGGKDAAKDGGATYDFSNVVVNLAGTMGTRYLKTSFVVTAAEKNTNVKAVFEGQKAKLTDITLNVLSSLTLADLEEPGAKNVLREKLVAAYNQAFGKRVVDQVYFSDFVVQ
jgi:flagellar FliL protein